MALTLVEGYGTPDERCTERPGGSSAGAWRALVSHAVSRARVGDGDAFEFLYARYADDVYGCVCGIVEDRREAEDVTQHVFAELMRRIGAYEERDTFLAWALRLAREVAVDHTRRQRLMLVAGAKA